MEAKCYNLSELYVLMERINMFRSNIQKLLLRYERFSECSFDDQLEWNTYFDVIIVQLRALCIENHRYPKNYTMQNMMREFNRDDLADRIDVYLDTTLIYGKFSLREAIKFIADKFICHYDDVSIGEQAHEFSLRGALKNQHGSYGLIGFIKEILDILMESDRELGKVSIKIIST